MFVLKDVCFKKMFVSKKCLFQKNVCFKKMFVSKKCSFQKNVRFKKMFVSKKCSFQKNVRFKKMFVYRIFQARPLNFQKIQNSLNYPHYSEYSDNCKWMKIFFNCQNIQIIAGFFWWLAIIWKQKKDC